MYKTQVYLFLILLSISCGEVKNHKSNITGIDNKKITLLTDNFLIGKWYSNGFKYEDKIIKLTKDKQDDSIGSYGLFSIEFLNNGNLIFKDLTKNYVCGNGIKYIDKGTWEIKKYESTPDLENILNTDIPNSTKIIFHVRGGYLLDAYYEFKREYNIDKITSNTIIVKTNKSILEKYQSHGSNFLEE